MSRPVWYNLLYLRAVDMSSPWSHRDATMERDHSQDFDNAEKGLYDNTHNLPVLPPLTHDNRKTAIHIETVLSPLSPIHEGITPFSSVPALSLSWPAGREPEPAAQKPVRTPKKISRWILFQVWFNPYKKFFTLVTLLNLAGIIMAALGRFAYAEKHLGALVLGNLLCAVLMRNELFLRFLYTIAIYGLRGVCLFPYHSMTSADESY